MADISTCCQSRCCYCWSCQANRLSIYADKEPDFLLEEMNAARKRENESVEAAFAEVLNQISMSKAFRQQIYNLFKYKNTACFFKSVQGYSKEDSAEKANIINKESKIYDRFKDILVNLKQCPYINIKRLSVNQLYMALDGKWCHMYNEILRDKKGQRGRQVVEKVYEEEDFADFLQVVKYHPVYQAIDRSGENNYGRREISALFVRAQNALMSGR